MRLTDRIKNINGVVDASWNAGQLCLSVYYLNTPLDTLKILVLDALEKASLQQAVERIQFYNLKEEDTA